MGSPERFCWPNPQQEQLLKACILDGDAARSAWQSWRSGADFENLDEGSHRLLPEAYTNLMRLGVEDELLQRMKGVKRRTWLANQLLFHQATVAIRALQERGMETMVAKGPALVLLHYRDHGRRPMADFDIVVKPQRAKEAIAVLKERGFRRRDPKKSDENLSLLHAVAYVNETGRQFDLHWHVLAGCTDDHVFWDRAVTVTMTQASTLAPSSTDLLFHICVHGLRSNLVPPLRWIVDASVILEDSVIDWDRFGDLARKFLYEHRMHQALEYLKRFEISIPEHAIKGLRQGGRLSLQRVEFEFLTGGRRKSAATQLAKVWLGFKRFANPGSSQLPIAQLAGYLRQRWRVERAWILPLLVLKKGLRRLFLNPSD